MNILIVEDEPKTARLLQELIENEDDGNLVIGICESIESTVDFMRGDHAPIHLIFMDVQVTDGLSFEIFKRTNIDCPVIFCTAFDHYALEAFKVNGVGYVLKPFRQEDITRVFKNLQEIRRHVTPPPAGSGEMGGPNKQLDQFNTFFLVRLINKMFPIPADDIAIAWLENEIVRLVTFKGESHVIFRTMDEMESALNTKSFFRINRQMIVNRHAVSEIEPFFNRKMSVRLKVPFTEKVIISRLKVTEFLRWMEKG